MIRIAAAGTKPSKSGWESMYAITPARNRPTSTRTRPTMSARPSPRATYSGLPTAASGARAPNVSRADTAVGPGCRYGDDEKGAAASGGIADAYSPRTAGIPASWAYATPWGMTTSATEIPATRSPGRSRFQRPTGPARSGASRVTISVPGLGPRVAHDAAGGWAEGRR